MFDLLGKPKQNIFSVIFVSNREDQRTENTPPAPCSVLIYLLNREIFQTVKVFQMRSYPDPLALPLDNLYEKQMLVNKSHFQNIYIKI